MPLASDVSELLKDLTPEQREAATHVDGPLLIIAGAGSGKTRVITRRVAYLMAQGIQPWTILAITFTNKAAGEMKERVSKLLTKPLRDFGRLEQPWPMICTFHSLCLRILRHYAEQVGLPANFTIYDTSDQTKLIKEALKALDISSTNFSPGTVHSAISNAKNKLLSAELYAQNAGDFFSKTIARVYTKYAQLLKANNGVDFDDLLLKTAEAFRDHPQVLRELQERFGYVMIDEYQDTNHAQYVIAHALAQRHRNMCVVGDPDQSIYAWRGADIQNILDFETDYPDAKVVRLERNYRSTKTILRIASDLISRNRLRKEKKLWTENAAGEKAKLFLCQDDRDEARVIAEQLRDLHDRGGFGWNQMAIFYRMNSLSRVMEDALRNANMPYVMARGVEFYNRKEIKDTLAYLRVIANPADEVSLTRIVNVPTRGIGDSSVKQMQTWAISNGTNLWGAMEKVGQVEGLSARAVKAVQQFVGLVKEWRRKAAVRNTPAPQPVARPTVAGGLFGEEDVGSALADGTSPAQEEIPSAKADPTPVVQRIDTGKGPVQSLMEDVVRRSGLEAMLKKDKSGEETGESGLDNVNALITSAAEYDLGNPEASLEEYLNMISLVSDTDHMKGSGGAITMMTLHAAKGLEFPVVAMIGLEEGILPHGRARGNPTELEEERRLCFVGITRAQERLILSRAAYRMIRGLRERTILSPFLGEIPAEVVDVTDRTGLDYSDDPYERRDPSRRLDQIATEEKAAKFKKGQLVRHPTFGLGRIADINQTGLRTVAQIDFNAVGRKTLVLEVARLEAVGH
jgi:DNA helicase-2/ATP-dependent DNA helicase PcrA